MKANREMPAYARQRVKRHAETEVKRAVAEFVNVRKVKPVQIEAANVKFKSEHDSTFETHDLNRRFEKNRREITEQLKKAKRNKPSLAANVKKSGEFLSERNRMSHNRNKNFYTSAERTPRGLNSQTSRMNHLGVNFDSEAEVEDIYQSTYDDIHASLNEELTARKNPFTYKAVKDKRRLTRKVLPKNISKAQKNRKQTAEVQNNRSYLVHQKEYRISTKKSKPGLQRPFSAQKQSERLLFNYKPSPVQMHSSKKNRVTYTVKQVKKANQLNTVVSIPQPVYKLNSKSQKDIQSHNQQSEYKEELA